MIRVLQVIGGLNRGGAETMLMNIYRCIDRTQVQFDFLIYFDAKQDYEDEVRSLGGRVIRMSSRSSFRPFNTIANLRNVMRQYGPYKAIHIHTLLNAMFPLLACIGNREILKITHSHNTQDSISPNVVERFYEIVSKRIIRSISDIWLACGHGAGEYLFGSCFKRNGQVLPNGILLKSFTRNYQNEVSSLKVQMSIQQEELVIGSVARLAPVKNHSFMLRIAHALKERGIAFKMLFVGRGPQEEKLREETQRLGVNEQVIFLGVRKDIPQLLQLFDVFLMPSLFEGTPVALIEAQASQLPCLISATITNDVDLEAGLIRKCTLSASATEWAEALLKHNRRNMNLDIDVEALFKRTGYNAESSAEYLQNVYLREHA